MNQTSLAITFRLQRSDYIALARALTPVTWQRVLFDTLVYLVLVSIGLLLMAPGMEAAGETLRRVAMLQAPAWLYLLLLVGPTLSLLRPWLAGLVAALIYRRNAVPEQDVSMTLDPEAIEARTGTQSTRAGWAGIARVIVTGQHLFLVMSRREALVIPRRAVADEAEWQRVIGFIYARRQAAAEGNHD